MARGLLIDIVPMWLESFCMASDMYAHIRTAFELIPHSFSIFNPIARGATGSRNVTRISRIWHWYYAHLTDHWDFTDTAALAKLLKTLRCRPRFVFCVFPGIDEFSHLADPRHERTIEQYRWLDRAVGEIFAEIDRTAMRSRTAVFLVSDHGLSATHTHFCVNTFLADRGLPAFFYPLIFEKRGKLSANMVSGNGMTHVYFKNTDGWARHSVREEIERLSPGILQELVREPAIDIVAVRGVNDTVHVLSRRGEAIMRLDGDALHYEIKGADPFGYRQLPDGLSPQRCLDATIDTEYPDAPFQLTHLLQSPRAGDLIISATPGYDLRLKYEHPEHRGSHGSLHASHMRVPMLTNLQLSERNVRTADLFPTALSLLGHEIPGHVDGVAMRS